MERIAPYCAKPIGENQGLQVHHVFCYTFHAGDAPFGFVVVQLNYNRFCILLHFFEDAVQYVLLSYKYFILFFIMTLDRRKKLRYNDYGLLGGIAMHFIFTC